MTQFIVGNEIRMANIIDTVLRKLKYDQPWEIVVRPYKKTRSGAQNSLLWVWLTELEKETGNDKETLHEYMKQRFLGVEAREIMGREVAITNSSKKLKVAEFSEYLRNIEAVAVENGYILSHPVDYDYALNGRMPG